MNRILKIVIISGVLSQVGSLVYGVPEIRIGSMEEVRSERETKEDQFVEGMREIKEVKGKHEELYEGVKGKFKEGDKVDLGRVEKLHKDFEAKYSEAKKEIEARISIVEARRKIEELKVIEDDFIEARDTVFGGKNMMGEM